MTDPITYVVVVHGIGEQRKNETVISVVNRFAEARGGRSEDDNRDILTLGHASGQTGVSKEPGPGRPWMEFEGVPAKPGGDPPAFLGEPSLDGANLRFVDLCWSDVMQDYEPEAVQSVDVWSRGLLGRLLRKHEDAERRGRAEAEVPFWIRRVTYLVADLMMLVGFAMNFRFKEMKDLVFAKFLGDVQQYGEFSRCRGRAVRRFHDLMARIEAEHAEHGDGRPARYVIVAHSLGTIMSLDALLFAHASREVRLSPPSQCRYAFDGYLEGDERAAFDAALARLKKLDAGKRSPAAEKERRALLAEHGPLDTSWIWRVEGFVTLGSPIDKYLMVWWSNYRYLLEHDQWFTAQPGHVADEATGSPARSEAIPHFNYCDEQDPVGHNLDTVRQTGAYRAVFECREDIVFNRYRIPGAAHNEYWNDQALFRWILANAVDGASGTTERPKWFDEKIYGWLLWMIYGVVPLIVVAGAFFTLSLALAADGWQAAALASAVFATVVLAGRRLIDLSIWWRQIQRLKSGSLWEDLGTDRSQVACWPLGTERDAEQVARDIAAARDVRAQRAGRFRARVTWLALLLLSLGSVVIGLAWASACGPGQSCGDLAQNWALVIALTALGMVAYRIRFMLPRAYRTAASGDVEGEKMGAVVVTALATGAMLAVGACIAYLVVLSGGTATLEAVVPEGLRGVLAGALGQLAIAVSVAAIVYTYRWRRFQAVRGALLSARSAVDFAGYAAHP